MEIRAEDLKSKPMGRTKVNIPAINKPWNALFFNESNSQTVVCCILHIFTVY